VFCSRFAALGVCLALVASAGCYGRSKASTDGWHGMSRAEIEAQWGAAQLVADDDGDTVLYWEHSYRWRTGGSSRTHVQIEDLGDIGIRGELVVRPGEVEAEAEVEARGPRVSVETEVDPVRVRERTVAAQARIGAAGTISDVHVSGRRYGPPRGQNVRWGPIFGLHLGLGRLDSTSTALPSGGAHIGGMLGPRHALVGTFTMVSGREQGRGAMGFSWGVEPTYWPTERLSVRAGPAMVLDWKPGFERRAFGLAASGGASYALVRTGSFVLDARLDMTAHQASAFGTIGIGVNRH
jgi:hypothetical protein